MGLELARAYVVARGDVSQVASDLTAGKGAIVSAVKDIQMAIAGITAPVAAMGMAQIYKGLGAAGKFEQTTIAFETMIGSVEETQKVLKDLTEFAAKTPFEMPEIEQAARGLIMFGERGDELMETLDILGNAASGTSSDFGMLALIFNQVRGVGRLLTQDFRQLSTRGVMSLQDIADHFGVTTAEAQKMLSAGQVSFEDLRSILKRASEEGGRFANLMERQSTSYLGLMSTLSDAMGLVSRALGEGILPMVKLFVSSGIQAAEIVRGWVSENKELASSIILSVTAVTSLTSALLVGRIAARLLGVSLRGMLIGTGIGIALVAIGALVGWLVYKFKLMEKIKPMLDGLQAKLQEFWQEIRIGMRMVKNIFLDAWTAIETWAIPIIEILKQKWSEFFASVSEWMSPWVDAFVDAFQTVVTNLDVMLGSWEGLREGILYITEQTVLGFEALWESAFHHFKMLWLQAPAFMLDLIGGMIGNMRESLGDLLGPLFESTLGKIESQLGKLMSKAAPQLGKEQKRHKERMAELGADSLELLEEWKNKMAEFPKLSEWAAEEWERAKRQLEEEAGKAEEKPGELGPEKKPGEGIGAPTGPGIEGGRFGFAEYGKHLQDLFMKTSDPQERTARATEAIAASTKGVDAKIGEFMLRAETREITATFARE